MPKFRVFGIWAVSKDLGIVEAETKEEAEEKAYLSPNCDVSFCHQCSAEVDLCDNVPFKIDVEEQPHANT